MGVAAAFRLRNIVKLPIREAQAKACGYKKVYCDTASMGKGTGLNIYLGSFKKMSRLAREKSLYGLPGHEKDIYPIPERVKEIMKFHEVRLKEIERIFRNFRPCRIFASRKQIKESG